MLISAIVTLGTLIALAYSLSLSQAYGHASPIGYIPSPNEIINLSNQAVPNAVTITFTETPEPRASSLKVVNSNNERVDQDNLSVSEKDNSLSISLDKSKVKPGVYTANWLVLSKDDGHITKGTYVFTVEGGQQHADTRNQSHPRLEGQPVGYSKTITTDENITLNLSIVPLEVGQNTFGLSISYKNGSAVENIRNVFMEFANPIKDLGPISNTMVKVGPGTYSSTGAFLSQTGTWEVKIVVQRINEYDINQEITLNVQSK